MQTNPNREIDSKSESILTMPTGTTVKINTKKMAVLVEEYLAANENLGDRVQALMDRVVMFHSEDDPSMDDLKSDYQFLTFVRDCFKEFQIVSVDAVKAKEVDSE